MLGFKIFILYMVIVFCYILMFDLGIFGYFRSIIIFFLLFFLFGYISYYKLINWLIINIMV